MCLKSDMASPQLGFVSTLLVLQTTPETGQNVFMWWREFSVWTNMVGLCRPTNARAWQRAWGSSSCSGHEVWWCPLITFWQWKPGKSPELLLEDQRGCSLMSLGDWSSYNSSHHDRHTQQLEANTSKQDIAFSSEIFLCLQWGHSHDTCSQLRSWHIEVLRRHIHEPIYPMREWHTTKDPSLWVGTWKYALAWVEAVLGILPEFPCKQGSKEGTINGFTQLSV